MRRKDREVTEKDIIFDIIERCSVVHLAMVNEGKPYVVALNFGFERQGDSLVLYFHSSYEGQKMDIMRKNPNVFFQMDCINKIVEGNRKNPCAYGWKYESVMGSGRVEFIDDSNEKSHALNCMIRHLGKTKDTFSFPEEGLRRTCVYQICSTDYTGKHHE